MQTILHIEDIAQRAKKIRLSPKDLAQAAGLNFATFYRGRQRPGSTSMRNLSALSEALVAREVALRDYLLALHPLEAARVDEAA